MISSLRGLLFGVASVLLLCVSARAAVPDDAYETYIKTSKDFRAVRQEKAWCYKAFPSWIYMPWTAHWTIGYSKASGEWATANGYNGAFIDGNNLGDATAAARLDWINEFHLRFYLDHAASKHYLHLWDGNDVAPHLAELKSAGVRTKPVNEAMRQTLQAFIKTRVDEVKSSPYRAAYALDDEASWGHFVRPTMWCVTDDKTAYAKWLHEIYGPAAPKRDNWITYDAIRPKLADWSIKQFDASPLLDQWSFNDSYWCNFLGDLVEYANSIDPQTPCGIVGAQSPNAFGGYDYAKLMRKVQYIEAYNIGSSQAVIRSFNPGGAIPAVTSHFHQNGDDDIWQVWYYLSHGNRGHIGWVEGWFDGDKPKPWHAAVAPTYLEAGKKIGPLMSGAEWLHDGVAIYYSHPSIQLGWVLDAEAHGKTWPNRNGDERLGSSHQVRHAWENMLRDEGLQYNFISYADVIREGIPKQYKVLILPACICLSDVEARRIRDFCVAGGTVIADYLPGLWDQHGKGRAAGGVLDDLFGVRQSADMTAKDLFGGRLWCELDQDANFSWKTYHEFLTNGNTCIRDQGGFDKAIRGMPTANVHTLGKGKAVLMNLSPQWYNAYRTAGAEAAAKRSVFMDPIHAAGLKRWVSIAAGGKEMGYEMTYFKNDGRTVLFVCMNPETSVSSTGGGNAVGLRTDTLPMTVTFDQPVADVKDERSGLTFPAGREFKFDWKTNEAMVISFKGEGKSGR